MTGTSKIKSKLAVLKYKCFLALKRNLQLKKYAKISLSNFNRKRKE